MKIYALVGCEQIGRRTGCILKESCQLIIVIDTSHTGKYQSTNTNKYIYQISQSKKYEKFVSL